MTRTLVSFDYIDAHYAGDSRHACLAMCTWAAEQSFQIIGSRGQSLGDCYWFWLEHDKPLDLPSYVRDIGWLEPLAIDRKAIR